MRAYGFFLLLGLVVGGMLSCTVEERFPAQTTAVSTGVSTATSTTALTSALIHREELLQIPTLDQDRSDWAVDPFDPGSLYPLAGTQSLFDDIYRNSQTGLYEVPETFEKLRLDLAQRLLRGGHLDVTLIPLGRSLQRNIAAPDFFLFPRVVLAVTGNLSPQKGLALNTANRLFLGYIDKEIYDRDLNQNIKNMEVISYNELMGRFEFQIVRFLGPGHKPVVDYADRNFCISCHQNQAPIFPRRKGLDWEETKEAPDIGKKFSEVMKHQPTSPDTYLGIENSADFSRAYAVDTSTDEANVLQVIQRIWKDACGISSSAECRLLALEAAIYHRLSWRRGLAFSLPSYTNKVLPALKTGWQRQKWSAGLKIPNPDIPNRNPLAPLQEQCDRKAALDILGTEDISKLKIHQPKEMDAKFRDLLEQLDSDPRTAIYPLCNPRMPRLPFKFGAFHGSWQAEQISDLNQFVLGLADFFTEEDIHFIDSSLRSTASTKIPPKEYESGQCHLKRQAQVKVDPEDESLESAPAPSRAESLAKDVGGDGLYTIECEFKPGTAASVSLSALLTLTSNTFTGTLENLSLRPTDQICQLSDSKGASSSTYVAPPGSVDLNAEFCPSLQEQLRIEGTWDRQKKIFSVTNFNELGILSRFPDTRAALSLTFTTNESTAVATLKTVYDFQSLHDWVQKILTHPSELPLVNSVIKSDSFSRIGFMAAFAQSQNRTLQLPQAYAVDPAAQSLVLKFNPATHNPQGPNSKMIQFDFSQVPVELRSTPKMKFLRPYFKYCWSCHGEASSFKDAPKFMETKKQGFQERFDDIQKKIQLCGERIYSRLNQPGGQMMPPSYFFVQSKLSQADFFKERISMNKELETYLGIKHRSIDPNTWIKNQGECSQDLQKGNL